MYPELKENRPHGTDNYPYTQYHMHNIFHAFQIPVHWHDELEVIYTKKGPLNLLIDGKEYTAEDGSVYFVAPGQLSTTTPSCFLSNLFRFSRMILWNGNFSFPCGTTPSPFPVNFQRITTQ